MKPSELGRLIRTVRPLRTEQVLGRVLHEARLRAFRKIPPLLPWVLGRVDSPPAVALKVPYRAADASLLERAQRAKQTGRALLAGHDVSIRDWHSPQLPKLVRYHLEYLELARDFAEAQEPELALTLVKDWMQAHPSPGGEAWEPYPVSVRLQSISYLAAVLGPASPEWLRAQILLHARFVQRFPEVHLQGNHLFKNHVALTLAGAVLEGDEAAGLAREGLEKLRDDVAEQVLEDGGHCERSPMYHLLALADLLDVRDFLFAPPSWLEDAIARMAQFTVGTLHPDGEVPLFNDAVMGQAPPPRSVLERVGRTVLRPAEKAHDFRSTGLVVLRPSEDEVCIVDAGALGPEHQSGHAHSDTLSYELSVNGRRCVVNAGMDGYQSERRPYFRSAQAHNTVTVNGEGPDELWASFRVGGRSRIMSRRIEERPTHLFVEASLAAFQGWTQRRVLALFPKRALVVYDEVNCSKRAQVVSRARILQGVRFKPLVGVPARQDALYAPRFGQVETVDEWSVSAEGSHVRLAYALLLSEEDFEIELADLVQKLNS